MIDSELMESINDDDGKHLTKKEVGYRLFEGSRWRTLEKGALVAAKVNTQEMLLLCRVVQQWDSPGELTYKELKQLSEVSSSTVYSPPPLFT